LPCPGSRIPLGTRLSAPTSSNVHNFVYFVFLVLYIVSRRLLGRYLFAGPFGPGSLFTACLWGVATACCPLISTMYARCGDDDQKGHRSLK